MEIKGAKFKLIFFQVEESKTIEETVSGTMETAALEVR